MIKTLLSTLAFATLSFSVFAYAEISSFQVYQSNNMIIINWTASQQVETAFFLIERSDDMNNWEVIQDVPGAGTTNDPMTYETSDFPPFEGFFYYRISEVAFSGVHTSFDAAPVVYGDQVAPDFDFNPQHVELDFHNEVDANVTVYSLTGNLLFERKLAKQRSLLINTSAFPAGIYIICTNVYGHVNTQKMYIH